jgi:hypothetical protein
VPSFFRPLPSPENWGLASLLLLAVAIAAYLAYRSFHDKQSVARTTLIGSGLVVSVICSLVLVGGWAASFIHDRLDYGVPAQTWSVAPPAPGRIDADLIGDNGQVGLMTVTDSTLTITDLPGAGSYAGSIDTQPASDAGVIKATVVVRDWWLYAFAAVLLGVGLGFVVSRFSLRRPARELDADAADALAAVARQESDWYARSVGQAWGAPYTFAGYAEDAITDIRESAESNPDGADTALKTFKGLDKAMEALRGHVSSLGRQRSDICTDFAAALTAARVDKAVLDGPGWLAPLIPDLDLTGQDLEQAQATIKARTDDVRGVKEAADLAAGYAKSLDQQAPRIRTRTADRRQQLTGQWVELVQAVLGAVSKEALEPLCSQIDALGQAIAAAPEDRTGRPLSGRQSMAEQGLNAYLIHQRNRPAQREPASAEPEQAPGPPVSPNRDTLVDVTIEAGRLAVGTSVYWNFSDGSTSATFPAPPPDEDARTVLSIRHCFVSGPDPASAGVIREDGQAVAVPWHGPVGTFSAAQRLRAALAADDRIVAMVAAVLAVASGMAALYLKTPAWGSAGDYVAALLWGSVTSEGIRLIVTIVGKRWPTAA